jgi:ssDNA-binding Zn-finger/Zn-ribbon topoisomerase 1
VDVDIPICPVCGGIGLLKRRNFISGRDSDTEWVWVCPNYPECDTYVGCYPSTPNPLGTMANRKLRQLRCIAHKSFDRLWKSGRMTRSKAYTELALFLGVRKRMAHIGMLDEDGCRRVIEEFNKRRSFRYKVPKMV